MLLAAKWWTDTINAISKSFTDFFEGLGQSIVNNIVMSILILLMFIILIVVRVARNAKTIEITTDIAVNKVNAYLDKNPFITEENLVEFNRLMLNTTKPMKFQWQRYVVERTGKPSDYLSEENCITKPIRTNSYQQGIKNFILSSIGLFLFSVILIFASNYGSATSAGGNFLLYLIVPIFAFIISIIYASICSALNNAYMVDLYYSFTNFTKKIDRAVTNMPDDIDHEILFTPKEIRMGIPALQEYLQKRALDEQEQIKRAKEREVEHETYNFEALGVNGGLVMERALKESETYLGNRRRLTSEIEVIQTEKATVTKDYDEENKTYQRNLRDIREEIQSLKKKLETVSDEITRSSLRRQQKAAIEKEQGVEAQVEKANNDYEKKVAALNAEIDKKRKELEDSKGIVESNLIDEFKSFTDKTYAELERIATNNVEERVRKLETERNEVYNLLEEKDKIYSEKIALYEEQNTQVEGLNNEVDELKNNVYALQELVNELRAELESKDSEIFETKQQLESRRVEIEHKDKQIEELKAGAQEIYRYFDAEGREFYLNENGEAYYLEDESGETEYAEEDYAYSENIEENVEPENYDYETYDQEEYSNEVYEPESYEAEDYVEGEEPVTVEDEAQVMEEVAYDDAESVSEEEISNADENAVEEEKKDDNKHKGLQHTLDELASKAKDNIEAEAKLEEEAKAKKESGKKSKRKKKGKK